MPIVNRKVGSPLDPSLYKEKNAMTGFATMRGMIFVIIVLGFISGIAAPCVGSPFSTFWATYGESGSLGAASITEAADGGYFAAGGIFSSQTDSVDVWVIRLDGNGKVLWENTYGEADDDYANAIRPTGDGGCIIAGYTQSFGAGSYDAWVIKLKADGSLDWQKAYGGAGYDYAASVEPTADGGYVVAGGTDSFGSGQTDLWVIKVDGTGAILWQKTFGGTAVETAVSVRPTSDLGFVVVGGTQSSGEGDFDFLVLKLDANGSLVWQKTFGGADYDFASSVRETVGGGYIVVGETRSFGAGDYDLLILQLDAGGNIVWQKTIGGTSGDHAYSVEISSDDGGSVVAGGTNSQGKGDYDLLLLKLDASGAILWQKTFGGTGYDLGHSIEATSDGGYVVAGETRSFGTGDYDFFILKLDGSGNLAGTCSGISSQSTLRTASALSNAASGALTEANSSATVTPTAAIVHATAAMTQSCLYNVNTLTLTSPNGGESWAAGSTQSIKWSYTGNPGTTVKIELIKGAGAPVSLADTAPIGSSGSGAYSWAIPSGQTSGADYKVTITATTYSDTSAANFTVTPAPTITLTSPNGGESWAAGSTQSITWTYTGNPGTTLKIELIKGGGTPTSIARSTAVGTSGTGSYAWKIPTTFTPGIDYKVQITSTTYAFATDTSAEFTVNWMH